ncbi:hypothetical protein FVE85_1916 [Porphyridium purpureum]|uniref:Uncharacterized protein n=1 Tax=Porphyridium purpureum TaxID=35688 RepID=A0A5J4YW64_PORPP|nr:hypothetical protein FVE85_1916 [Porphyridium purpureum]|eukprot:POR8941..scf209_3
MEFTDLYYNGGGSSGALFVSAADVAAISWGAEVTRNEARNGSSVVTPSERLHALGADAAGTESMSRLLSPRTALTGQEEIQSGGRRTQYDASGRRARVQVLQFDVSTYSPGLSRASSSNEKSAGERQSRSRSTIDPAMSVFSPKTRYEASAILSPRFDQDDDDDRRRRERAERRERAVAGLSPTGRAPRGLGQNSSLGMHALHVDYTTLEDEGPRAGRTRLQERIRTRSKSRSHVSTPRASDSLPEHPLETIVISNPL